MIHPLRGGYDKVSYSIISETGRSIAPFRLNSLEKAPDRPYTRPRIARLYPRIARLYPRIARLSCDRAEKIEGRWEVESARGALKGFYFESAMKCYDTCIRSHKIAWGAGLPDGSRPHATRNNFYKTRAGLAGGAYHGI